MQKLLLFVITAALLFACGDAKKTTEEAAIAADSNWATSHLKGKVKTIEETQYTADENGQITEMDSCCIDTETFSDKGYIISYSEKDKHGTAGYSSVFTYNDNSKLTSVVGTENGEHVWSRTIHYDDNGKSTHAEDTDSTKLVTRVHTILEQNDIGQAVKGKTHLADSTYLGTWAFKYIDGMRTGNSWVDSTGTELTNNTGILNDKGLMAKMTLVSVGADSTTTKVVKYSYDSFDDAGNWTQKTKYGEDGKVIEMEKRAYTYYE